MRYLSTWGAVGADLAIFGRPRNFRWILATVALEVLAAGGIKLFPGIVIRAIAVLTFLCCAWWLIAACRNLGNRWHDHGFLRKIERGGVACTSFVDMLDVRTMFRTQRALLLFVQDIKRREIPVDYPPALRALQAFAAITQMRAVPARDLRTAAVSWLEPNEIKELNRWSDSCRDSSRRLAVSQDCPAPPFRRGNAPG